MKQETNFKWRNSSKRTQDTQKKTPKQTHLISLLIQTSTKQSGKCNQGSLWLLLLATLTQKCAETRLTLPLGDLQGVSERRLSLEGLLIKETLDGVSSQLFHDDEGLREVQQHGEVMILTMSQHVDALSQKHIGGFL